MSSDFSAAGSDFPVLRFMATLKAARDFGLDQGSVNAVALRFDPRRSDVERLADALAAALLRQRTLSDSI